MSKNRISKILICIFSMWFGMSALIDFVAVPTVFRNVSNLSEAGKVGMTVFSVFNILEVVFGLLTLIFLLLSKKRGHLKWMKTSLIGALVLIVLSLSYKFYITPSITKLNQQKYSVEMESPEYQKYDLEHQFFHKLYVKLDGFKLLLLLGLLVVQIKEEETVESKA